MDEALIILFSIHLMTIPNLIVPNGQEFRDLYDENGNINNETVISMDCLKFVSELNGRGWIMSFRRYCIRLPSDYGLDLNGTILIILMSLLQEKYMLTYILLMKI